MDDTSGGAHDGFIEANALNAGADWDERLNGIVNAAGVPDVADETLGSMQWKTDVSTDLPRQDRNSSFELVSGEIFGEFEEGSHENLEQPDLCADAVVLEDDGNRVEIADDISMAPTSAASVFGGVVHDDHPIQQALGYSIDNAVGSARVRLDAPMVKQFWEKGFWNDFLDPAKNAVSSFSKTLKRPIESMNFRIC